MVFGTWAFDHGKPALFREIDDVLFLRVKERADERQPTVREIGHGRKASEPPFEEEIHHKGLDGIVVVVTERHLVAPCRLCFRVEGASAHFGTERAGVRLLSDVENDLCDLGRDDAVLHAERVAKCAHGRKMLPLKTHVDRNGDHIVRLRIEAAHLGKSGEQCQGILSSRDPDGDAVAVLDHAVIINGAAGKA